MYNKLWKKISNFKIILVSDRLYLREGQKNSNLKDIQTI